MLAQLFSHHFFISSTASYPCISGTVHTNASRLCIVFYNFGSWPSQPDRFQWHIRLCLARLHKDLRSLIYLAKAANMGPGGPIADSRASEHPSHMRFNRNPQQELLGLPYQSPSAILYTFLQFSSLSSVLKILWIRSVVSRTLCPAVSILSLSDCTFRDIEPVYTPPPFSSWMHFHLSRSAHSRAEHWQCDLTVNIFFHLYFC